MTDPAALVAAVPEPELHAWVLDQRWFASKSRDVAVLNVLERVVLREEAPLFVLALIEARFHTGTHELYQLPVGLRPASDGLDGAGDRRGRGLDGLRRARRSGAGARAAAVDAQLVRAHRGRGNGALPLGRAGGGAGRRGVRRRAADRRGAVQLLDRVRRGADPEGVPQGRAGRQPGARAAALPAAPGLPPHRAARRLVRVRRPADGLDARHAAGVPGRRARGLAAVPRRPRGVRRARARARAGDRRDAFRAGLGSR